MQMAFKCNNILTKKNLLRDYCIVKTIIIIHSNKISVLNTITVIFLFEMFNYCLQNSQSDDPKQQHPLITYKISKQYLFCLTNCDIIKRFLYNAWRAVPIVRSKSFAMKALSWGVMRADHNC